MQPLSGAAVARLSAASEPWGSKCSSWLESGPQQEATKDADAASKSALAIIAVAATAAGPAAPPGAPCVLAAGPSARAALVYGGAPAAAAPDGDTPQDASELLCLPVMGRLGSTDGRAQVYSGRYAGAVAAVKVMHPANETEALAHAVEMAVLSCARHPAIVQAYRCAADAAELPPSAGAAAALDALPWNCPAPFAIGTTLRFRCTARQGEPGACNVIVTEFCDQGTLKDALACSKAANGGSLMAACEILADVASALEFLHSQKLVHGNVRSDNVLLKTSPSHKYGLQVKLCGFGSACIRGQVAAAAASPAGAGACAPAPLSDAGSVLPGPRGSDGGCASPGAAGAADGYGDVAWGSSATPSDDVFAFGALVLEAMEALGSGRRGAGVSSEAGAGAALARDALRCGLGGLAWDCLAPDPRMRPSMAGARARLGALAP